jgi:hypothetical protein
VKVSVTRAASLSVKENAVTTRRGRERTSLTVAVDWLRRVRSGNGNGWGRPARPGEEETGSEPIGGAPVTGAALLEPVSRL